MKITEPSEFLPSARDVVGVQDVELRLADSASRLTSAVEDLGECLARLREAIPGSDKSHPSERIVEAFEKMSVRLVVARASIRAAEYIVGDIKALLRSLERPILRAHRFPSV